MADPLGIVVSIAGIINAAVKVTAVLGDLVDAPAYVHDLCNEISNIRIIFKALQDLIGRPQSLPSQRAAMISLEDVVDILTETVLVFLNLEAIIEPLAAQRSALRMISWVRHRSTLVRLDSQLQRHKTSLNLILQIVTSNSVIEAADAAATLRLHAEEQAARSTDMCERLERMQLSIESLEITEPGALPLNLLETDPDSGIAEQVPVNQATLDQMLENTIVYRRAVRRTGNLAESDSVISRSWSILSGISMAQISVLAVVNLPLDEIELERFRKLADLPVPIREVTPKSVVFSGTAERRLQRELRDMEREPSSLIFCGPIDDDILNWEGSIIGPSDTPYSGGVFFVAIRISSNFPFRPPQIRFTTRVYHPNIDINGSISCDLLNDFGWYESMTIYKNDPFGSDRNDPHAECLCPDIARIYWTDRVKYDKTAREWTRKYAM
ncbi:hypothetical protein E8E13_001447 [Curvularia kusanoi]|uniref:UBC core domain-containing protein n=1 Tax=Curvularia kusanoi TaxID=90978 RepID=A0A9P4WA54_CURKU|nr:hypothetical protein E8E13_001447 [Curvularia kusanoi]